MTLRCWLLVGLTACSFEAKVPASASISCANDGECPRGLRCQPGTHRCVLADRFDDVPPALARSEVTLTPNFGNPLAKPGALGFGSTLELRLTATEPLDAAPVVTVIIGGEKSAVVVCSGQQTAPTTSEHRCGVSVLAELETPASLLVTLTDLAKNAATVTLAPPFAVDTRRPSPPEPRGALLVSTSPWGDAETNFRPSTRVLSSRALPGVRQLLFRKGGVELGSATLDDAGTFAPVELLRADDQLPVEAATVDEAGNVSDFMVLGDELWTATFKGKVANQTFPNPHRLQVTGAISLAIEGFPIEERGERDGIVTDGGAQLEVEGAGTWVNLQLKGSPGGISALASVALDPLRSRVISFGGARFVNGQVLVSAETWVWNGRDWRERRPIDPESDGNPEGRIGAACTWDPSRRAFVIAGGTSDEPLNDVWAWNGISWKRLPDLPAPRRPDAGVTGRIASLLYWDAQLRRLVFTGGTERIGLNERSNETFSLDDRAWVQVPPLPFGGRAGAAIATDTETGITVLVGGGHTGEVDVWVQQNGAWQPFDAGPGPSPRSGHAFIYDPTRGNAILFGHSIRDTSLPEDAYDTWEFDGESWGRIARQLEPPEAVLSNDLVWLPPNGPLFALTQSAGVLEAALVTNEGWLRTPTTPGLPRANVHTTLVPSGVGVIVGGDALDAPARVHFTLEDGGWGPGFELGMAAGSVQAVSPAANTLELLHCCSAGDSGTLMVRRISVDGGVQVTEVTPQMQLGAMASAGALGTAVLGRAMGNGINTLSFISRSGTVTSSWPMPTSLVQPRLVPLPGRNSLVMPGGQSFTGTATDPWEFRLELAAAAARRPRG